MRGGLNAVAPGNFNRLGKPFTVDTVTQYMIKSFQFVYTRYRHLLSHTLFGIILSLVFIIGLCVFKGQRTVRKCRWYGLLMIGILGVIAPVIVIFPVVMGYSGWIPNRCLFVSDITSYILGFAGTLYFAKWICDTGKLLLKKGMIAIVGIGILLSSIRLIYYQDYYQFPLYTMSHQLQNGEVQRYHDYWIDIYEQIQNKEGDVIEITSYPIADTTALVDPNFVLGDSDYANPDPAQFFGKKKVYLYWE